ncbi:MAG: efflux RND transporter permease subunit, partial [Treponema sp.]|nr:efflux RND transporter permease subunit [Treponema sp.]
MKELVSFCVRRPVSVIMSMAALVIAALFSLSFLPLDRFPEFAVPRVTVETLYPGMAASEVRSMLTIPVEDALSPVKGLERIRSVSRDGASVICLDFRWGTDPMTASVLVREALDAVYPGLPEGVHRPAVVPGDPDAAPDAIVAVRPLNGSGVFARNLAEYELRARLRRIDGVGSIVLVGGEQLEERLRLDLPGLAARGIAPADFARLLSAETLDLPAGNAREGDTELIVQSSGRPASAEELSGLVLPFVSGGLKLGEAGDLTLQTSRLKSVFIADGEAPAALEVYRRPGSDPVRLSRDIAKTLREASRFFSGEAEIRLVKDSSPLIVRGLLNLGISALLGAAAVVCTLFFFLRRVRLSLLAALSIPVSAAAGVCALALAGRSLNGMSLGGLALGIGLVSDTGVIMLDTLHRFFGERNEKPDPPEIGRRAASIAGSSAASTVTTAVVFIPVVFLPGPLGSLFGDTAVALTASIGAGWLYAQFCIPALYRLGTRGGGGTRRPFFPGGNFGLMEKKYRGILAPLLRRPEKIFFTAVLASALGGLALFSRPAAFVSPGEAEEALLSLSFPPGTVLETIGVAGRDLSEQLLKLPCVGAVYGRAGSEDDDFAPRANIAYRREELILHCVLAGGAKPEKALGEISLATGKFSGYGEPVISASLPRDRTETFLGISSGQGFAVRGNDREELAGHSGLVSGLLKGTPGTGIASVRLRPEGTRPELRVYPDREAAAFLGISSERIAETLHAVTEGLVAARLEIEGRPLDLRVSGDRISETAIRDIPLISEGGTRVSLGSLGRIERLEAEAVLARLDRSDVIFLDAEPEPGARGKAEKTMRRLCARFPWLGRENESAFSRYRISLFVNLFLVLVLLYMTMGAQFESFLLPLVLMLSIPFSLAGAGPALILFGSRLDSGAVLGLTALFGLVVNNGLILFETSDEKICRGFRPAEAVYAGASERLRPILVTSATTILALLPLVLSPQDASRRSMPAAMLGGLAASTLLSLFALPPVFIRFFAWRE